VLHVTFSDATISASNRALRATVRRLSWGFPKIAPPSCAAEESTPAPVFALQESTAAKDSHRNFGTSGATADPCSVSAVFRRPDGLRLSNPARILQRAADHGVHDVLKRPARPSPHRVSPALRSLLPVPSCPMPLSWNRAGRTSPEPAFTEAVHRRPFPLTFPRLAVTPSLKRHPGRAGLEAFLQDRARCADLRFQKPSLDTPLGLPLLPATPLAQHRLGSGRTSRRSPTLPSGPPPFGIGTI